MKDHYYIQLTNDSSSLNKINEPVFDAIKLALENNQQHKNVPMFALPTTLSVVPDKFMVYSNISRLLTKEILDTIAKNVYGESFLQTTADEIEVLRSIDTHLILSPGNWIIDIVDEINGIGGRIIPVSFIRRMITEVKIKGKVYLDVRFIIGMMKGGEGFETISGGLIIPKESNSGAEVSSFVDDYVSNNEWQSHPEYPTLMSKQTILPESELVEKAQDGGEFAGKDTAHLLEISYSLLSTDYSKLN